MNKAEHTSNNSRLHDKLYSSEKIKSQSYGGRFSKILSFCQTLICKIIEIVSRIIKFCFADLHKNKFN